MHLLYTKLLHFGKSVPNLLRGISRGKVTADLVECPTAVFGFSWDGSDGRKGKRKDYAEGWTLHQLCADKIKIIIKRSWDGYSFTEESSEFNRDPPSFSGAGHPDHLLSLSLFPQWPFYSPDLLLLLEKPRFKLSPFPWILSQPGSPYPMPQFLQPSLSTSACLLLALTNPFHIKVPRIFILHSAFICLLR